MPFILCWIEHGIILQNEGNDNCPLFFVELNMASFFRMKEMTIALYSLLNLTWHHSSEWRKWQLPFILCWIEHGVILQNERNDNCPLFFIELNMAPFFGIKETTIALYSSLNWTWRHSSEWRKRQLPFILRWIEHGVILQNEGNDNCPLFFVELNMAPFFGIKETTIALYSSLNWTWRHSSE